MKKKLSLIAVIGLSLAAAQFANAQAPIATNQNWFVVMPDPAMPDYNDSVQKVIADVRAGTIASHTNAPTGPGDYMTVRTLTWYNLVTETTNGMELNRVNDVKSVSGNNDIALAGYSENYTSSDGGVLNGSQTFATSAYTPGAPLYMNDGAGGTTVVKSGDATQQGNEFIVITHSKQFLGGSQANLNAVKKWVSDHDVPSYTMTFTGQIGNVTSTSKISTSLIYNDDGFKLKWTRNGPSNQFSIEGADPLATYQVVSNTNLMVPSSSWTFVTNVVGTSVVSVPMSGDVGFFAASRAQ